MPRSRTTPSIASAPPSAIRRACLRTVWRKFDERPRDLADRAPPEHEGRDADQRGSTVRDADERVAAESAAIVGVPRGVVIDGREDGAMLHARFELAPGCFDGCEVAERAEPGD